MKFMQQSDITYFKFLQQDIQFILRLNFAPIRDAELNKQAIKTSAVGRRYQVTTSQFLCVVFAVIF
jgi:hypothetical protein